jgi:hypothetical protein
MQGYRARELEKRIREVSKALDASLVNLEEEPDGIRGYALLERDLRALQVRLHAALEFVEKVNTPEQVI